MSLVSWPRRIAWAAALLATASVGIWFLPTGSATEAHEPDTLAAEAPAHLDLLEVVRTGRLPEGLDLPAFYQDPSRIGTLEQSAFSSPSPLVKQWLLLDRSEKAEILRYVARDNDPGWLVGFLGELAFSGITFESDPLIAQQIEATVRSVSSRFASVALFLLDHIERVCPHDLVRQLASEDASDIRARVGALGH